MMVVLLGRLDYCVLSLPPQGFVRVWRESECLCSDLDQFLQTLRAAADVKRSARKP